MRIVQTDAPKRGYRRATVAEIEKALHAQRGHIGNAAKSLGVSRNQLVNKLRESPRLQKAKLEAHEAAIDYVEDKLFDLIDSGDTAATLFYLKCQAKHRGYVERQEVQVEEKTSAAQIAATIRRATASGAN